MKCLSEEFFIMNENIEIINPVDIERRSFEIIESHLEGIEIHEDRKDILKRVIHTTADFDYVENLKFSENAVNAALDALKNGACIVTDTKMAFSGINKKSLGKIGGEAYCFISDDDVVQEAAKRSVTRAVVSMEKACTLDRDIIFAVGNAPTALIALDRLVKKGKISPKLIIGVPVGFVNVCESKEIIMKSNVPYIVAKGNKGGSNVAAAICNALIYKLCR
jgi:precorrin-8X/cobalt-precorrin-8 methylmutase